MTKSKGILPPRKKWSADEDAILSERYPNERAADIAKTLGVQLHILYARAKKLGLEKSEEFKASEASGRTNGKHGQAYRFPKGNASWNKGRKGLAIGGVETQFKKGAKPHNYKQIGSERIVDGYLYVKTEDPNKWVQKHYLVWQEKTGALPPKGSVLAFKDGNKMNFAFENLELLSRNEWMSRNTIHQYPEPLKEVIRLSQKLRRKLNVIEQQH